ncbi:MAG TPA: hypothetical protein DDX92_07915 [Flavobacteriales bacterium]|jgi:protease II|nr:hypothetical protein [Flavobacteriales bacterium]
MKHYYFLLVTLWCTIGLAQNNQLITGTVCGGNNESPLPYAYVMFEGLPLGTVTEPDGSFRINIPVEYLDETIRFSYMGFESKAVAVVELIDSDTTIVLVEKINQLNTVTVTPEKVPSAKKILKKALKKIPQNYASDTFSFTGYYRETIQEYGYHIRYTDAVVAYRLSPYELNQEKVKSKDAFIVYDPFALYTGYLGDRLHRVHFHWKTKKEDQAKIMGLRASNDLSKTRMHANIEAGPMGILSKDRVNYQSAFFGKDMFKKYRFTLREGMNNSGDWVYRIAFEPFDQIELDHAKRYRVLSKLHKSKPLQGEIEILKDDLAITHIAFSVPSKYKEYFCSYTDMAYKHFDYKVETKYEKIDDSYRLVYARHEDEFIYRDTNKNEVIPYSAVSEFFLDSIHEHCAPPFSEAETILNSPEIKLNEHFSEYDSSFWMNYQQHNAQAIIVEPIRMKMEEDQTLEYQFVHRHTRDTNLAPPVAFQVEHKTSIHGDILVDQYHWLKDVSNPLANDSVMAYLDAENHYFNNYFKPLRQSEKELLRQLVMPIPKSDSSLPTLIGGFYYQSIYKPDEMYPYVMRYDSNMENRIELFNLNELSENNNFYTISRIEPTPSGEKVLFLENTTGTDRNTLKIKDVSNNSILSDSIENVGNALWLSEHELLYTSLDPVTFRANKLIYRDLNQSEPKVIYEEKDPQFSISISQSSSREIVIMSLNSKDASEIYFARKKSGLPSFKLLISRELSCNNYVQQAGERFYRITDQGAPNYRILSCDTTYTEDVTWKEIYRPKKEALVTGFLAFEKYYAIREKEEALNHIKIVARQNGKTHRIRTKKFSNISFGKNPHYKSDSILIRTESFQDAPKLYSWNMSDKSKSLIKDYKEKERVWFKRRMVIKRLWATSKDSTKIPITVLSPKYTKDNYEKRLYMTSYGAYGTGMDVQYSLNYHFWVSLGFTVALVHVRGGDDMGTEWHEKGLMQYKQNTFDDFIASAELLIEEGYTKKGNIVAEGSSAGGLLMGAATNMRPDLFKLVILNVPFVDVTNTMLDESLPLTTLEYDEWGNPNKKEDFKYMMSYDPYQNIRAQDYPNMLFITGLNDSRVGYYEPAKMVAKLRYMKTDDNIILLKTDYYSGHSGSSGRFESFREDAMKFALVIELFKDDKRED